MNLDQLKKNLVKLIKLDIDAVNAYESAIKKISEPDIKERIKQFKDDHERHIENISEELKKMGETPPNREKDFKGYLLEGFTALRSITGTSGALEAMQYNEEHTNKKYKEATGWDTTSEIHLIILKNYEDEQKHLAYINSQLESKAYR